MKRLTHEEFLERLTEKNEGYRNKEFEVVGEYIGAHIKIELVDKYGICGMFPKHLLRGHSPSILSAKDKSNYFIEKSLEVHRGRYTYEKVKYTLNKNRVVITCSEHGDFLQLPLNHLKGKGCDKCARKITSKNKMYTTEDFIQKLRLIHGDTYNYSLVKYRGVKNKIKIICNEHGPFNQIADAHLQGKGCMRCARSVQGWAHSQWKRAGERSRNFDSFKVYIIRCWNDEEEFLKIGKTFRTVYKRFQSKNVESVMPYKWETIWVFEANADEVSKLERELHRKNKTFKYVPKIEFGGMQECYIKIKK